MPEGCVVKLTRIIWCIFAPGSYCKQFKKERFVKNFPRKA